MGEWKLTFNLNHDHWTFSHSCLQKYWTEIFHFSISQSKHNVAPDNLKSQKKQEKKALHFGKYTKLSSKRWSNQVNETSKRFY